MISVDLPALACACAIASGLVACATTLEEAELAAFDAMDPIVPFADPDPELEASPAIQPDLEAPDSLDGLIARASRANPELRAAWHEYRAAVRQMPAARKLPEPVISYAFHALPVETRVGPMQHQFGVKQALPWPTRLGAAANVAAAKALVRRRHLETLQARVRRDIRRPWADLAWQAQARELLREEDALLASVEGIVRARLSVGQASYDTLTRLGLRRAELREREESLADAQERVRARLRGLADLDQETQLPEATFEAEAALPAASDLVTSLGDNPALAGAVAEIRGAEAAVEVAEAARMPDFGIGLSWTIIGPARMAGVSDSGRDALMITASARLPFWFDAYEANEDAARARVQAAEARSEHIRRQAEVELAQLLSTHAESTRRASLYERELIPGAEAALESVMGAFAADRAGLTDVLEVERQLLRYRLGVADARRTAAHVAADLDLLLGRSAVDVAAPEELEAAESETAEIEAEGTEASTADAPAAGDAAEPGAGDTP